MSLSYNRLCGSLGLLERTWYWILLTDSLLPLFFGGNGWQFMNFMGVEASFNLAWGDICFLRSFSMRLFTSPTKGYRALLLTSLFIRKLSDYIRDEERVETGCQKNWHCKTLLSLGFLKSRNPCLIAFWATQFWNQFCPGFKAYCHQRTRRLIHALDF